MDDDDYYDDTSGKIEAPARALTLLIESSRPKMENIQNTHVAKNWM